VRHLVLGTAGHIDHGKSALVRALTGTDPDRLKEEQLRGITIELGFADLELPGGMISFVDVPGHERFVRHMVAGATGLDAVLLVVAADQAVQPQTREHLDICALLGIQRGIVVLSKSDLVDEDLLEVVELEVREYLENSFLADAPLIAVSAKAGTGLDLLRSAMSDLFDVVPPRPVDGIPRLPVDRSFVLRGFGTVVTGTLASGVLRQGDEVEVLPGGARGRVRGLQVHHSAVEQAESGQRTAVNLQSLSCDDVPRGSVLIRPGALRPTRRIWARMRMLPSAPKSLTRGGPVRFHQGTCERDARVKVLRATDDPAVVDVEIFLAEEAVLAPGDRFIIRRPAPLDTVAGGTVADVRPPRSRLATSEAFAEDALEIERAVRLRLRRSGAAGKEVVELATEIGLPTAQLETHLAPLIERNDVVRIARRVVDGDTWRDAAQRAIDAVTRFHERSPLSLGIAREALRAEVADGMPQDLWRRLLDDAAAEGAIRLAGESVAVRAHEVVLSDDQRGIADEIERRFLEGGLGPPEVEAVVTAVARPGVRQVLELLVAEGKLTRIHDGKLYHSASLAALRDQLAEFARTSPSIDVAAFKELAGVTRKHAIPLLEHLDSERSTRRNGNLREILLRPART